MPDHVGVIDNIQRCFFSKVSTETDQAHFQTHYAEKDLGALNGWVEIEHQRYAMIQRLDQHRTAFLVHASQMDCHEVGRGIRMEIHSLDDGTQQLRGVDLGLSRDEMKQALQLQKQQQMQQHKTLEQEPELSL